MISKNTSSSSFTFREKLIVAFSLVFILLSFAGGFLASQTKIFSPSDKSFTVFNPSLKEASNQIVDASLDGKGIDAEIIENLGEPVEITPVENIELSEAFNILQKYSKTNSFEEWVMEEEGEDTAILRINYQGDGFARFYLTKKPEACDLRMDWLVYKVELPADIGNCSDMVESGAYTGDQCGDLNYTFLNFYEAVKNRDYEAFEKYADMDAIATNVMEDSIESTKRVFDADSPQVQQIDKLTDEQKESQVESIKSSFKQGILTGEFLKSYNEFDSIYGVYMDAEPKIAEEGVTFPFKIAGSDEDKEDQEIELVFNLVDGEWKVTRFKIDFDKVNQESKKQHEEFLEAEKRLDQALE